MAPSRSHARFLAAVAITSALIGTLAAVACARAGLTLSHPDARAHLIVARRIIDSITPGWQQIGAVWLPLPHLLNALPVQIDLLYRTGASAVVISILSFVAATSAIAHIVEDTTRSRAAALAAAAVFGLNPDVLYLQSTPMTEPLYIALVLGGVVRLGGWSRSGSPRSARAAGVLLALACLTRYEAWPVAVAAIAVAGMCRWLSAEGTARTGDLVASTGRIALYPAAAIAAFSVVSRVVIGSWYARDFFVPDNPAQGRPLLALGSLWWGLREVCGPAPLAAAAIGAALLVVRAIRSRRDAPALLTLTLAAAVIVPLGAFVAGHPFRIRYVVPLVPAVAICAGVSIGAWAPGRRVLAGVLVVLAAIGASPFSRDSPVAVEARWDLPDAAGRRPVTACLEAGYRGETIMASMGSLAHYMQELSGSGFAARDFLHEGNGDIWLSALERPRPFVGWIMIEEKAERGGLLAQAARERPEFLNGFERACEGGGVVLYRRLAESRRPTQGGPAVVRSRP